MRTIRIFLCIALALLVIPAAAPAQTPAAAAVSVGSEDSSEPFFPSWEERLAQARLKYNEETVNIYSRGRGKYRKGKINVYFYPSSRKSGDMNICIRESLQITDEAEMEAILELAARDERYDPEEFGSIAFMKAQWIAHNLAHSMATGSEEERRLVETLAGESLSLVVRRAKELDISQLANISARERILYELIELIYGLDRH